MSDQKDHSQMNIKQVLARVNMVSLIGLAGWAAFTLIHASSFPGKPFEGDYGLNILQSIEVVDGHNYQFGFAYPLPCVLLRYYLFKAAGNYSGWVWFLSVGYSMYFIMKYLIQEFYTGEKEYRYIYALIAFLQVAYYVQYDIRQLNINLIVLCLVLKCVFWIKKESYSRAAFFLCVGVALKLYPVFIVGYFFLRKQYRFVLVSILWLAAFFVVIPSAILGTTDFVELTRKWLASVAASGAPDFVVEVVAYKMSLHYAVLSVISHNAPATLTAETIGFVNSLFSWIRTAIVAMGLFYVIMDIYVSRQPNGIDRDLFATILILVGSLLLTDLLQPHHGAFLLAASLLIMNFALFTEFSKYVRYGVLAAALLPAVLLQAVQNGVEKSFAMNLHICIYIVVLVFLRFYMPGRLHAGNIP